jgi:hypothetical protein
VYEIVVGKARKREYPHLFGKGEILPNNHRAEPGQHTELPREVGPDAERFVRPGLEMVSPGKGLLADSPFPGEPTNILC